MRQHQRHPISNQQGQPTMSQQIPTIDPEETCLKQSVRTRGTIRKSEGQSSRNSQQQGRPTQNQNENATRSRFHQPQEQQPSEEDPEINQEETILKQISQPPGTVGTCLDELIELEMVRTSPITEKDDTCSVRGNLGHSRDCLATTNTVNLSTDTDNGPPTQQILCPVCDKPIQDDAIECDQCETFIHFYCENIDDKILEAANKNKEYICSSCFLKNTEDEEERTTRKVPNSQPNAVNEINTNKNSTPTENNKTSTQKSNDGQQGVSQSPESRHQTSETPTTTKTNKRKTTKGNNNYPKRSSNAIKHYDCIETERKIALLQEEVARLEDIIVEQKNTIRIHKMRAAAASNDNIHLDDGATPHPQNSMHDRLRCMELENLRTRITVLELESKLHQQTTIQYQQNLPKQQTFNNNLRWEGDGTWDNADREAHNWQQYPQRLSPGHRWVNRVRQDVVQPDTYRNTERSATQKQGDRLMQQYYSTPLEHSWDRRASYMSTQPRAVIPQEDLPRQRQQRTLLDQMGQGQRRDRTITLSMVQAETVGPKIDKAPETAVQEQYRRQSQRPRNDKASMDKTALEVVQRPVTLPEQARPGHSWDSLAMSTSAHPGKVRPQFDETSIDTTATEVVQRPVTLPEQARPGHSWDSLAMSSMAHPGKMRPHKDETSIDTTAPEVVQRPVTLPEQARPGHSWDSLAMSSTTHPGKVRPQYDETSTDTTAPEVVQRPVTLPEQTRPGHSWDSLAMSSTALPGTVGLQNNGISMDLTAQELIQHRQHPVILDVPSMDYPRTTEPLNNGTYTDTTSKEVSQWRQSPVTLPEQARPGHSWDSLAMPTTAHPGTVEPQSDGTSRNTAPQELLQQRQSPVTLPEQPTPGHSWDSCPKQVHTKKDETGKATNKEDPSVMNCKYTGMEASKDWDTTANIEAESTNHKEIVPCNPEQRGQRESDVSRDCLAIASTTHTGNSLAEEQNQQRNTNNTTGKFYNQETWIKHQIPNHILKYNLQAAISTTEGENTRTPNLHHFLSKGRANTEVSHRRPQFGQTTRLIGIHHQTPLLWKNIPNQMCKRVLHPNIDPTAFYQGRPLFRM